MNIFKNFQKALSKWSDFNSRTSRAEFWGFMATQLLINVGLIIIKLPLLYFIFSALMIVPNISILVRRLHDLNLSGILILLGLIPVLGPIILFIMTLIPGQQKDNIYGPTPLQENEKNTTLRKEENQESKEVEFNF